MCLLCDLTVKDRPPSDLRKQCRSAFGSATPLPRYLRKTVTRVVGPNCHPCSGPYIHRARSPQQAFNRRRYLDTVFAAIPTESFTREIGKVAAKIDAEARLKGIVIPFADLLIGGTALHLGYGLITSNLRHFQKIPDLDVIPF